MVSDETCEEVDAGGLLAGRGACLPLHGPTEAVHIGESDLPFVDLGDGTLLQLLHVDLSAGLWVVRVRFPPARVIDRHYHTGSVFAVTLSGTWWYAEYPDSVNTTGSYLFEPAHSVHTLTVGDDGADVWFAINGANIGLADDGSITGVTDPQSVLSSYVALCDAAGLDHSRVLVLGRPD